MNGQYINLFSKLLENYLLNHFLSLLLPGLLPSNHMFFISATYGTYANTSVKNNNEKITRITHM